MVARSTTKKKTATSGRKKNTNGKTASIPARSDPGPSLELLLDQFPGAVISIDPEGRIRHMNLEARALLGKPSGDVTVQDWPQFFGLYQEDNTSYFPNDRLPPLRALQGEVGQFEEMILRPNGDSKQTWILMTARRVDGQDGLPAGATAFIREITERKQSEVSRERFARRLEAFYRLTRVLAASTTDIEKITQSVATLAAEAVGDLAVITLLKLDGRSLSISAADDTDPFARELFEKVTSRVPEYPTSRGMAGQVIRTGEPLLIPSTSRKQMLEQASTNFAEYLRQVDLCSVLIVPLIGRSGVLGTLGVFRHTQQAPYTVSDQSFLLEIASRTALAIENSILVESLRTEIAARLSVKEALEASQERFRSIFEKTSLGVKVLDLVGTILDVNPAFQEMLGYSRSEMVGRNFYDFLHPDDVERGLEFFNSMKTSSARDFQFEHRVLQKKGGTIWVKSTFTGARIAREDESLGYIFGILENTTDQKRIEAEMSEMQQRLQSSLELERLRVARDLHDGPMQELYSAMYRVKQLAVKVDPQMRNELDNVNHDIQRVLHDLRATAKELRPPAISNFGLEKAIRSHAEDFQLQYPEIKLNLQLAQDRQLLPEDMRLALFRVYQHAMGNVVRHAHASEIWVYFSFDAEEVRLEIRDNGQGFKVPPSWISFVREGHYGLAGAAERMNAVGGVLEVESQSPQATLVRAVIPLHDSKAHLRAQEPAAIVKRARDLI